METNKTITKPFEKPVAILSPQEIITRLKAEYGVVEWSPRRDPVSELIVTILSQHTSDLNAERAFKQLLRTFKSLDVVAKADIPAIRNCIYSGGLSRIKAPRIKAVLTQIQEKCGTLTLDFLESFSLTQAKAWLTALPGVGPKTAAVVLCFALGMPAMPVDTHVHRIVKRLGLVRANVSANHAHDILESIVTPDDIYRLHVYLITHGRQVCKARRPLCQTCVLINGCPTGLEQRQQPLK